MNKNEMISIIIPVYNVEPYLKRCIESVICQTYTNLEIILVDDGSTDSSGSICDEYEARDDRIFVYHIKNGGPGAARNYGIEHSEGKYITFVDSDDWIEPEMYEKLMNFAKKNNTEITGCAPQKNFEDGTCANSYENQEEGILSSRKCILDILYQTKNSWGAMYNKIYKRDLFDTVRFPNVMNLEDYVVSLQLYYKTDKVYFCKNPMYHYSIRSGSLSKSGFFQKKISVLKTSEKIRKFFIDERADREIILGTNHFVFRMYSNIFWEIYKAKPEEWKELIRKNKKKSLQAFKNFIFNSKKQEGDLKRLVQFFIVIFLT